MARITVEDCLDNVDNRFQLVLVATKRARQIALGADPMVPEENDKATVIALREIAEGLVGPGILDEEDKMPELSPYDARLTGDFDLPPGAEREMPGSLFAPIDAGDGTADSGQSDDDTDAALIAALQREFSQNMFNDPIPETAGGLTAEEPAGSSAGSSAGTADPGAGYLGSRLPQSSDMLSGDDLSVDNPDNLGGGGLGADPIASVEPVEPTATPAPANDNDGLSATDAELLAALTADNFGSAFGGTADPATSGTESSGGLVSESMLEGDEGTPAEPTLESTFGAPSVSEPSVEEPVTADALFGGSFSNEPSTDSVLSTPFDADSVTQDAADNSSENENADSGDSESTDEGAYGDPTSRKDSTDLDN